MGLLDKFSDFFGLTESELAFYYKDFGTFLKKIRTAADMTTSDLANKSGVSQSYISQLENNVRLPSDKVMEKLAFGLVERNNPSSTYENFSFSSDKKQEAYNDLLKQFTQVRNYMRIKDIPSLVETNTENETIFISEKEKKFLELLEKIPSKDYDNLLAYMKFLVEKGENKWITKNLDYGY